MLVLDHVRVHLLTLLVAGPQATIQTLVEKLQPLFPEMAHQRASNDTLCDAIQSCETCLRHAHLSLQVSPSPFTLTWCKYKQAGNVWADLVRVGSKFVISVHALVVGLCTS